MKTEEITLQEAALAWAHGKRVEAVEITDSTEDWGLIDKLGGEGGVYSVSVFTAPIIHRFRLAPEPPAKKFRPWTPEEVPVGAQIRAIGLRWRGLILSVCANREIHCMTGFIPTEHALANHEHSLDNGKTWLPCGVEVSE